MEHYKPTRNAWKVVAIVAFVVGVVATAWVSCGGVLRLGSSFQLELKTSPDIIIQQIINKERSWGA